MNLYRIISLFVILTVLVPSKELNAGIWDQIKSAFIKPEKPKPPFIKVLIAHDVESAQIEVKGRHVIFDPFTKERLTTHYSGKKGIIKALPTGIKWGEEFPRTYQVQIVSEMKGGSIFVDGVEYKGSIFIYAIDSEKISVVNQVDVEDYLTSTLSGAVDKIYSNETLAALAIAARTQAYFQSASSSNSFWQVIADQVGYKGLNVSNQAPEVKDAIRFTKYMILSQTGIYEGVITPFPVQLFFGETIANRGRVKGFSVEEAESLSRRGENASRILSQIFPNTTIELAFHMEQAPMTNEIAEKGK